MEGLHTTALLREPRLKNRKRMVRTHNIEHDYYLHLSKVETDLFKKYYFYNESIKLKKYESVLSEADLILPLSQTDYSYFSARYKRVVYLPAFHPYKAVKSKTGKGDYVLYHGNLSVPENINAATRLLKEVFYRSPVPFKIAGLRPPASLVRLAATNPSVELIASPSDEKLQQLIADAHIHLFFTDQATGLKLKLLNALYNGRFVLTNDKMLSGSQLQPICVIRNSMTEIKQTVGRLMQEKFTAALKADRQIHLQNWYANGDNVEKLIDLMI